MTGVEPTADSGIGGATVLNRCNAVVDLSPLVIVVPNPLLDSPQLEPSRYF